FSAGESSFRYFSAKRRQTALRSRHRRFDCRSFCPGGARSFSLTGISGAKSLFGRLIECIPRAWSSGMAQSACSASTPVLIQNVDSQRQCQTSDAGLSCTKECHHETAGAHWQLHRFLLVLSDRKSTRLNSSHVAI